jgi:hypothetical protein
MKKNLLLIINFLIAIPVIAQTLPEMTGSDIENKQVNLPEHLKGKYSLLGFATSLKAQADLETWLDPIYQKFIAKTGLMDDMYDVNIYFIPILTGTNISFATSMKKKFREQVQEDLKSHLLMCTENGKELIEKLNMQNRDQPYFFLLNKEGKILYRTSGAFTEAKFDSIDDLIE